jgi:hypothetical protein
MNSAIGSVEMQLLLLLSCPRVLNTQCQSAPADKKRFTAGKKTVEVVNGIAPHGGVV